MGFLIFESSRLPHENITLAFARQKLIVMCKLYDWHYVDTRRMI